jgi:hypothetical protein
MTYNRDVLEHEGLVLPPRRVRVRRQLAAARAAFVPLLRTAALVLATVAYLAFLALLSARAPALAAVVAVMPLLAGIAAFFFRQLPRIYFAFLGVCLVGYAFLGRGFAYLGLPPLYVGEMALFAGAAVLLLRGRPIVAVRSPTALALVALMVVGAAGTAPYLSSYGVDALRDAVVWAYGAFALIVAGLLLNERAVVGVLRRFNAFAPAFMIVAPLAFVVTAFYAHVLPRTPLSTVPIVGFKAGDVAVHLAGIMAFFMLGLHRVVGTRSTTGTWSREWFLWLLWLVALVSTLTTRASFVIIGFSAVAVMLLRPGGTRWGRLAMVVVLLASASFVFDLEIRVGRGEERPISAEGLFTIVQSIFNPVGDSNLDGSRGWRLNWWSDIVDYTLFGPYFWTGKGYGINLADADGYQVYRDRSLRSPHNGHLTILARSGVPGAALWLVLNVTLFAALARAYLLRRADGRPTWAHVNVWLIAYLLAFHVNAAFDVYLEGPQAGIWFWSLVGLSLVALRVQTRSRGDFGAEGHA